MAYGDTGLGEASRARQMLQSRQAAGTTGRRRRLATYLNFLNAIQNMQQVRDEGADTLDQRRGEIDQMEGYERAQQEAMRQRMEQLLANQQAIAADKERRGMGGTDAGDFTDTGLDPSNVGPYSEMAMEMMGKQNVQEMLGPMAKDAAVAGVLPGLAALAMKGTPRQALGLATKSAAKSAVNPVSLMELMNEMVGRGLRAGDLSADLESALGGYAQDVGPDIGAPIAEDPASRTELAQGIMDVAPAVAAGWMTPEQLGPLRGMYDAYAKAQRAPSTLTGRIGRGLSEYAQGYSPEDAYSDLSDWEMASPANVEGQGTTFADFQSQVEPAAQEMAQTVQSGMMDPSMFTGPYADIVARLVKQKRVAPESANEVDYASLPGRALDPGVISETPAVSVTEEQLTTPGGLQKALGLPPAQSASFAAPPDPGREVGKDVAAFGSYSSGAYGGSREQHQDAVDRADQERGAGGEGGGGGK